MTLNKKATREAVALTFLTNVAEIGTVAFNSMSYFQSVKSLFTCPEGQISLFLNLMC